MARIGLILGSTRPTRISPAVAQWALANLPEGSAHTYEVIDLAEHNLPLFDEPASPKSGQPYQGAHTLAWSEHIKGFDGFIAVLPEYNGGVPAVLKNAMDYLFAEWEGKPLAAVSYGFGAGLRSVAQLEALAPNYGLKFVSKSVNIKLDPSMYNEQGAIADPAASFASYAADLAELEKELAEAL